MPGGRAVIVINARSVVCLALIAYCGGIFLLAVLPNDHIKALEWGIAVISILAVIGLISRATELITIPGERNAYLLTGFLGLVTLLSYDLTAADSGHQKARASLLLIAGIIGSYGAHIAQGPDPDRSL